MPTSLTEPDDVVTVREIVLALTEVADALRGRLGDRSELLERQAHLVELLRRARCAP